MQPGRQLQNQSHEVENENEFLPKDLNSYLSMELDHEQRRSHMLANDHFFPQNSEISNKEPTEPGKGLVGHEECLGAFQSRKEEDGPERSCHEDEENEFMLDHNSLAASINQGLMNNQSNPASKMAKSDEAMVSRNEEHSFPLIANSSVQEEGQLEGNFQSKVSPYRDPNPLEEDKKSRNASAHESLQSNEMVALQSKNASQFEVSKPHLQESNHDFELKGESEHFVENEFIQLGLPAEQSQKEFLMNESNESFSKKPSASEHLLEEAEQIQSGGEEVEEAPLQESEKQMSSVGLKDKSVDADYPIFENQAKLYEDPHIDAESQPSQPINSRRLEENSILESISNKVEPSSIEQNQHKTHELIASGPIFQQPSSALQEAKSSIIKRIVIDDSPSRGVIEGGEPSEKKFQLKLEPTEGLQGEQQKNEEVEEEGRGLVESQVVKFQRPKEQMSLSQIQSTHKVDSSEPKLLNIRLQDIELNQNDSKFLQPIQDSIRSLKSVHKEVHSLSQNGVPELKNASINLSNMILDPVAIESGQNSSNIEFNSSVKQKKIQNHSSVFGRESNRYDQSISEFRKEQVRRMQERSSIEHLQSNITEGEGRPSQIQKNSSQLIQEDHYFNQFDRNEAEDPFINNPSQNKPKKSSVHQKSILIEEQSKSKVHSEDKPIREPPILLNQKNSKEMNQQEQLKNDFVNNSLKTSEKRSNISNIDKVRPVDQKSLPQADEDLSTVMKNNVFSHDNSIYESEHQKQELETANLLVSNNQITSTKPKESQLSLKESKYSKKVPTVTEIKKEDIELQEQLQIEPNIFNTFPQKPAKVEDFNQFQESHKQEEHYQKKISMTPQQKVKFDRHPRQKLLSQKDPFPLNSKKKEIVSRHQVQEDQIERIKLLKESHKKRLERQLQRVQRELQEINHKQKRIQRIYGELQKIETQQRTPKVSSHQNRHRRESEQFLKMVKEHRKIKEQEQLEFQDIDRNITNNLMELNKMRQETEDKKKEQKRLEIMERMKKNELRKINEQKQMKVNNHYVQQFKSEGGVPPQVPKSPPRQPEPDYVSNLNQKRRQSRPEQPFNLNVVSQPVKQHTRASKVTKIKSLSRKFEGEKYENKLN